MPTNCPICSNADLHVGAETCPKCGSDIEVFSHIESVKKEYAFQKKSILVLTAVLGIVMVSWGSVSLFSGNQAIEVAELSPEDTAKAIAAVPDSATLAIATTNQLLEKENIDLKSEVASLKSGIKTAHVAAPSVKAVSKGKRKIKAEESNSKGGVIIHTVKRGDSPWTISKKYFHNGSHAKQIVADNNLGNMKNIPIGTKLKIQK